MKIKDSHLTTLLVLIGLTGSLLALAMGAAAQAPLPRAESTWIELTTRHFVVVSEGDQGKTRELAADLERLVQALDNVFKQPGGPPERISVVLFSSTRAFEDTCTSVLSRSCAGLPAVLQHGGSRYALLLDGSSTNASRAVAYRELAHVFVRRSSPSTPLWLDTGLAELYGSLSVNGTDMKIGRPNAGYLALVQSPGALDLGALLTASSDSPATTSQDRQPGFVAGSWLLTHYLLVGSPDRKGQLSRYLAEVGSGRSPVEACATALGATPDALGKEVLAYAQGPGLKEVQLPFGELSADAISAPRELSRDEALANLATPGTESRSGEAPAAPQAPTAAPAETPPDAGASTGVTAVINTELQNQQRKEAAERAARSQKEADRYNDAVGLYNRKDYQGALRIAEDLAAHAVNAEVKQAATAFLTRIRAKIAAQPKP